MKNLLLIIGAILIASFLMSSCSTKDSKKRITDGIVADSVKKRDSISLKDKVEKNAEVANLNVRIFFNGPEEKTYEIKDFNKEKVYDYCYDVESFNRLQIEGNAKHISIIVKSDTIIQLKQENVEIIGKKILTSKDFDITSGSIIIKQGGSVLFEGKIESHGCM